MREVRKAVYAQGTPLPAVNKQDLLHKSTHTKLCRGDFRSYRNGQSGSYRRTANPLLTKMGHSNVWYVGNELLSLATG